MSGAAFGSGLSSFTILCILFTVRFFFYVCVLFPNIRYSLHNIKVARILLFVYGTL